MDKEVETSLWKNEKTRQNHLRENPQVLKTSPYFTNLVLKDIIIATDIRLKEDLSMGKDWLRMNMQMCVLPEL